MTCGADSPAVRSLARRRYPKRGGLRSLAVGRSRGVLTGRIHLACADVGRRETAEQCEYDRKLTCAWPEA